MILSPTAAEHVHSPRNAGKLEGATHIGVSGVPGDGPYVKLWLIVKDRTIAAATYECNGCPSSIAAASMAAQILIGRSAEKALLLEAKDLLLMLGGLPEGKEYYAEMAADALRDALKFER